VKHTQELAPGFLIVFIISKTIIFPRHGWRGAAANAGQKKLRIPFRLFMTFWRLRYGTAARPTTRKIVGGGWGGNVRR
jgi:hypothetical protein